MKLTRKQSFPPIIEPMLPLINVVFLLLIFFMIAGHIALPIKDISIPVQQQNKPLTQQQKSQNNWLTISANGELSYQQKIVELSALEDLFAHREHVSLLADKAITTGRLEQITRQLSDIGIKKVSLITLLSLSPEVNNK
jgi:biopolymer transport protein ExbD